jgi:quercetin dioxygenase-like cupin family protein
MKRLIVLLALAGAAVWAAVAVATPGQGQTNTIMSIGALQTDLAFNTGITAEANGLTWQGKQYAADQLPEFLTRLRKAGVTNLGEWLNLHPGVSAKFGMLPIGLLHSPEVVTQQATFAPSAASGWHSHPGYLTGTVVSGQVVRYGADCSAQTFTAGQTFYETAAKMFTVRNESSDPAVVMVTFVVPGGTPTTALRVDKPQPTACTK